MKRHSRRAFTQVALTAAAALCAHQLAAQGVPDVVGEWDVTINSPQGTSQALLTLKREGDGLAGLWKGTRGERPLSNVTLKGNEIRFESKVMLQGQEALFTYSGSVDKGAMKGTADFGGFATGDWSAVRRSGSPAAASPAAPQAPSAAGASGVDISGTWLFNVDTAAGSGQPTFTFKLEGEKLVGTYSGAFGQANLTGTLRGSAITFSFTADAAGQSVEITYTGKVLTKDTMEGSVTLGSFGEGSWSGKRQ